MSVRNLDQLGRYIGRIRPQNTLEHEWNQLHQQALREPDDCHEENRSEESWGVAAGVVKKPVEFFQACASSSIRKRSSAAMTRETLTSRMPSGATMTSDSVRQGAQIAGFEVLKRTTLGTP